MFFFQMFILLVFLIASFAEASQCTAPERAVWFNNQDFANTYRDCCIAGRGSSERTIGCMANRELRISQLCLTCFGQAAVCAFEYCGIPNCMADFNSPSCQSCIRRVCYPDMKTCVGARSDSEMPIPFTERERRGTRTARHSTASNGRRQRDN